MSNVLHSWSIWLSKFNGYCCCLSPQLLISVIFCRELGLYHDKSILKTVLPVVFVQCRIEKVEQSVVLSIQPPVNEVTW